MAEFQHVANTALVGERLELIQAKALKGRVARDFAQWGLSKVPQPAGFVHELVAGEDVPVVLQNQHLAAGLAEYAQGVRQAQERAKGLLEKLHGEEAQVVSDPLVERLAEKFAEDFRGGGAGTDPLGRCWIALDERKELQ
jgi:hypothetical protein